jgi:hypothetical protein
VLVLNLVLGSVLSVSTTNPACISTIVQIQQKRAGREGQNIGGAAREVAEIAQ